MLSVGVVFCCGECVAVKSSYRSEEGIRKINEVEETVGNASMDPDLRRELVQAAGALATTLVEVARRSKS